MSKNYSQVSRDRLALNLFIAIPVAALLLVIHHFQDENGKKLTP